MHFIEKKWGGGRGEVTLTDKHGNTAACNNWSHTHQSLDVSDGSCIHPSDLFLNKVLMFCIWWIFSVLDHSCIQLYVYYYWSVWYDEYLAAENKNRVPNDNLNLNNIVSDTKWFKWRFSMCQSLLCLHIWLNMSTVVCS